MYQGSREVQGSSGPRTLLLGCQALVLDLTNNNICGVHCMLAKAFSFGYGVPDGNFVQEAQLLAELLIPPEQECHFPLE